MRFSTRLFLLIFLVNGVTALVSTSIFLRNVSHSEWEELDRSMSLVVTVAAERYHGYIDRANAVLETVAADKDVRNFFVDHEILRIYGQQAARERLRQLIVSNPSIGDIVISSGAERVSMAECETDERAEIADFAISCDGKRAYKVLSMSAGRQVHVDVLVDLQRFVDSQVGPILRDETRLALFGARGTAVAVTGGSLSEGRAWISENGIVAAVPGGRILRRAGFHLRRERVGELDFVLAAPVTAYRRQLSAATRWAGATALFLIIVPGVIALVLSKSLSRRLRSLAATSRTLDGRHSVEIDDSGSDEVAELAGAMRELNARVVDSTEALETMVRQRTAVIEEQKAELVTLNERLREMASRDSLTGLLNRRAFEEQAANVFALARREERGLGIAMIDLDFFKRVNDEHGHQTGDEALRLIAGLLEENFRRDTDLIGRYGGEEFTVVTSAPAVGSEFEKILEEFREAVASRAFEVAGQRISLTVSCGAVVSVPGLDDELEKLLIRADRALYWAKSQGRNRVVLHRQQRIMSS